MLIIINMIVVMTKIAIMNNECHNWMYHNCDTNSAGEKVKLWQKTTFTFLNTWTFYNPQNYTPELQQLYRLGMDN